MKVRVWAGRPTLATTQGKTLESFQEFDAWLSKQADGQVEVWAGRWWMVAKEATPFVVEGGKCFCSHPRYASKQGHNPRDFPGFFAYEAWKIAKRASSFYADIGRMADEMVEAAEKAE